MAIRLPVDVEALTIDYLVAHEYMQAIIGNRIGTEIPDRPVFPLLRLNRIGGAARLEGYQDIARIQLESFALKGAKEIAWRTAATALAVLLAPQFRGVHPSGIVSDATLSLGLSWQPDPETERARYVFETLIYVHPKPLEA